MSLGRGLLNSTLFTFDLSTTSAPLTDFSPYLRSSNLSVELGLVHTLAASHWPVTAMHVRPLNLQAATKTRKWHNRHVEC